MVETCMNVLSSTHQTYRKVAFITEVAGTYKCAQLLVSSTNSVTAASPGPANPLNPGP